MSRVKFHTSRSGAGLIRPDAEGGFALVSVTLIVTSLLGLAMMVSGDVTSNVSNTAHVRASVSADGSANAGLAAAAYTIANGSFICQLGNPTSPIALPNVPNGGTASYSVSIAYYATYSDPETANPLACSQGSIPTGTSFAGVILTSTGQSKLGAITSAETVSEQFYVSPVYQAYALFDASALDLSNLQLLAPASTTNSGPGQVFADGNVSGPGTGACNLYATISSVGSLTFPADNCTVAGSLYSNSAMTLSQTTVGGGASVWNGNLTMSNSIIDGNVIDGGNIWLCPNPNLILPLTACSALKSGKSAIGVGGGPNASTSSATASGTVMLGSTSENNQCPGPVTDKASGNAVTGCVTPNGSVQTGPVQTLALPSIFSPVNGGTAGQQSSYGAWVSAGYSAFYNTTTCTGTGPGSVWYDIDHATGPTVVVATCTSNGSPTPLSFANEANLPLNFNIAVFAPNGISLGGGFKFSNPPGGSSAQLSLIIPTPTGNYSCSSGAYNITIVKGGGSDIPAATNGVGTDFFTPCTLSVADNVSLGGEAYVGSLSLLQPLQLTYAPFSIPGLNFGYSIVPKERYVTNG